MNTSDNVCGPTDLATRARWQRWEMESLEALRVAPVPPLHHSEAERRRAAARDREAEALAKAQQEGQARGYHEGLERGLREGHAQGAARGHAEGLEQGRTEGFSAGHQEGLAQGRTEGALESRMQAERLDSLTKACALSISRLEEETGQALVHLATHIAERVLCTRLQDDPDLILALIQGILQSDVPAGTPLTLHLHPEDEELVQTFLRQKPNPDCYQLVTDEHISRGGCLVETPHGSIDATLETRWRRVTAALGQTPKPR